MASLRPVLSMVLVLLGVACTVAHGAAPASGFERKRIVAGGIERTYLFRAPSNADNFDGRRPLVILLHGGGGSASYMASEGGTGFVASADRDGFYLAIPDAVGRMWDLDSDEVSRALPQRVDDLAFFRSLLDTLGKAYPIDTRRVFAAGISRGGQAAYYIACSLPGYVRAIAAVAMPLPRFIEPLCAHSPPLGLLLIEGTDDPLVPYGGGSIVIAGRRRSEVLSVDQTMAFWRERNGCDATGVTVEHVGRGGNANHVVRSSWEACSGAPVVLYRLIGGGHTWPSGKQYLPPWVVGKVNHEIDGAMEISAFFRTFR